MLGEELLMLHGAADATLLTTGNPEMQASRLLLAGLLAGLAGGSFLTVKT